MNICQISIVFIDRCEEENSTVRRYEIPDTGMYDNGNGAVLALHRSYGPSGVDSLPTAGLSKSPISAPWWNLSQDLVPVCQFATYFSQTKGNPWSLET